MTDRREEAPERPVADGDAGAQPQGAGEPAPRTAEDVERLPDGEPEDNPDDLTVQGGE